ncbi:aminoglycoside 6'-N-acetyltransferase [Sphingomonas oryzagri]|uniref:Aminoglycoside N(6')-acetyltransferase type 1 n=1 Tax=Sphingomonas oryzagri TaxID=3042314 RepID=A0ABT6N1W5_9SPHN|nr:aminoglycoside 6'-N-acetyltransferase [Sphingomonas oryzagri]MDH7639278.1 GNAT family N-acetyltransferase [Sphingomonas oryzagri]
MPAIDASTTVHICGPAELDDWSILRGELWADGTAEDHRTFAAASLDEPTRLIAFLARDGDGAPVGFAEASLRFDYVNGCATSPVGFLEGLYVREAARRRGIARGLVVAVEQWARGCGCTELASDALLENAVSQKVHRGVGFAETERVVFFRKSLEIPEVQ